MDQDVFISYAEKDKSAADTTCAVLESERVSCWIAPRDVQPGAKWEQAIMNAIGASRLMGLVLSEHTNRSDHVEREVGTAFNEGITVIPFRIGDTKPKGVLDYYLRPVQWIDAFTSPLAEHCKSLAIKVKELILGTKPELANSILMKIFETRKAI